MGSEESSEAKALEDATAKLDEALEGAAAEVKKAVEALRASFQPVTVEQTNALTAVTELLAQEAEADGEEKPKKRVTHVK